MVRPIVVVAAIAASLLLAGCTGETPEPANPAPTKSLPSGATLTPPKYDPDGSAEDNKLYFDLTNTKTISTKGDPLGRDFIDALVAAGFDKSRMEVSQDKTAIGLDADNIQFAIGFKDDCLVGQWGNVNYHSIVLPMLVDTGKCLIGETRPIDW